MAEKDIKLKPKKQRRRFPDLFENKKTRYPLMFLLMLPFIILIIVFGRMTYNEYQNILALTAGPTTTKEENIINLPNDSYYILRDNATDLQKDLFAQLKEAVEAEEKDSQLIAQLVAENYIADFYTWTNKQGQFDVGGIYYIYPGEYQDGTHYRDNVYLAARDGFYKYMSYYLNKYGLENLIEVESIEVTRCEKLKNKYWINEHVANRLDENEEWYDYREDHSYDGYNVACKWTYKQDTDLYLQQFADTLNLAVIDMNGSFYVVETSESVINGRDFKEAENKSEEAESEESESKEGSSTTGSASE